MNINKLLTKPVIEDYNPSQVNNYYTLLEQLEFIKQLLIKYPSQQFFNVKNPLSDNATIIAKTSVITSGRQVNVGDILFVESSNNGVLGLFKINSILDSTYAIQYLGRLTGEEGEAGERGPQGPQGETGPQGPQGVTLPFSINKFKMSSLNNVTGYTSPIEDFNVTPKKDEYVIIFGTDYSVKREFIGLAKIKAVGDTTASYIFEYYNYTTENANSIYSLLEGSETIVADLNEAGTAVELHLDNEVNNKITNSLQKPTTLTENILVGCSIGNGSPTQTNVKIGSGLQMQNGTLSATGSGGSTTIYQNNLKIEIAGTYTGEVYVYFTSKEQVQNTTVDIQTALNFLATGAYPMVATGVIEDEKSNSYQVVGIVEDIQAGMIFKYINGGMISDSETLSFNEVFFNITSRVSNF